MVEILGATILEHRGLEPTNSGLSALLKIRHADPVLENLCGLRRAFRRAYRHLATMSVQDLVTLNGGALSDVPGIVRAGTEVLQVSDEHHLRAKLLEQHLAWLQRVVSEPTLWATLTDSETTPRTSCDLPGVLRSALSRHPRGWWDYLRVAFREELKNPQNTRARSAWELDVQTRLSDQLGQNHAEMARRLDRLDADLDGIWRALVDKNDVFEEVADQILRGLATIRDSQSRQEGQLDSVLHDIGRLVEVTTDLAEGFRAPTSSQLIGSERGRRRQLIVPPWCSLFESPYSRSDGFFVGGPPLRINSDGKVDLDYGPLLLVDELILDCASTDRFRNRAGRLLPHLFENLSALEKEGFLRYQDLGAIAVRHRSCYEAELTGELQRVYYWLPKVQRAIEGWEERRAEFINALPTLGGVETFFSGGIVGALKAMGEPITHENAQRARTLMFTRKTNHTAAELELIKAGIAVYLGYAISNLLLKREIDAPFVDWGNVGELYRGKVGLVRPDQVSAEVAAARELFSVAIPGLAPKSAPHLLRVVKDPRVARIREFIAQAVGTSRALDAEFGRAVNAYLEDFGAMLRGHRVSFTANVTAVGATKDDKTPTQTAVTPTGPERLAAFGGSVEWLFCLVQHNLV